MGIPRPKVGGGIPGTEVGGPIIGGTAPGLGGGGIIGGIGITPIAAFWTRPTGIIGGGIPLPI